MGFMEGLREEKRERKRKRERERGVGIEDHGRKKRGKTDGGWRETRND